MGPHAQGEEMRRLAIVCLVVFLPGIGIGYAASAQSPSPSPIETGQRVEVAEAGIALTLPADWEVRFEDGGGGDGSDAVVTARLPGTDVTCEVYRYGTCSGEPFGDCAAALDEFAARMVAVYESNEGFEGVIEQASVDEVAEHAVRIDIEWTDEATFGTSYVLSDGQVHDAILCRGSERPPDRWLSIVETLEFLPGEEQAT